MYTMCAMSELGIDSATLRFISECLTNPCDVLRMREVCREWRDVIPAPKIPRMPPHRAWKWAMRRGLIEMAHEICTLGARDLARYTDLSIEECEKLWSKTFVIPCVVQLIEMPSSDDEVLRRVTSNASIEGLDYFAIRAAKERRHDLCEKIAAIRIAREPIDYTEKLGKYLLKARYIDLHARFCVGLARSRKEICSIAENAAASGSRKVCKYARELLNNALYVCQMLRGAVKARARSVKMLKLAREWIEERVARCAISDATNNECSLHHCSGLVITRADSFVRDHLWSDDILEAFRMAGICGNRAACNYLFEWCAAMRDMGWRPPNIYQCARYPMYAALHSDAYWIADILARWSRKGTLHAIEDSEKSRIKSDISGICKAAIARVLRD